MKNLSLLLLLALSSCATGGTASRLPSSASSIPGSFSCKMTRWNVETHDGVPEKAEVVTLATTEIALDHSTPEGLPGGSGELAGLQVSIQLVADRDAKSCAIRPCPWAKGTALAHLSVNAEETDKVSLEDIGNPYKAIAPGPMFKVEKHVFFTPVGEAYVNCEAKR